MGLGVAFRRGAFAWAGMSDLSRFVGGVAVRRWVTAAGKHSPGLRRVAVLGLVYGCVTVGR